MSIKFIYFDAGGVLFHFRGGLRKIAAKHNLPYSEFERVFRKHNEPAVKGHISPQELWETATAELGIHEELDYPEYWTAHFEPIIETHAFIKELISSGRPVGLITNLYAGIYERAIEKNMIPNLSYQTVIQSSVVHMMKPEKDIYLLAQEQSNTIPENILFIDDKPDFLAPAKELGWQTIQFDEFNPTESINTIKQIIKM